jgi:hypothetical protein
MFFSFFLILNKIRGSHRVAGIASSRAWILAYPLLWPNWVLRAATVCLRFLKKRKSSSKCYLGLGSSFAAEGIGGQLVKWLSAKAFADQCELVFIHTPFAVNPHSHDIDWEELLAFGYGECSRNDRAIAALPCLTLPAFEHKKGKLHTLGVQIDEKRVAENINTLRRNCDFVVLLQPPVIRHDLTTLGPLLQKKLDNFTSRLDHVLDSDALNIAVHIRRGDVKDIFNRRLEGWEYRWFNHCFYLNLIRLATEVACTSNWRLTVFTDGLREDIEFINELPEHRFYGRNENLSAAVTFQSMMMADVLIMGASSFSYLAAIASSAVVLTKANWVHETGTCRNWICADSNGNIGAESEGKLNRLIIEKMRKLGGSKCNPAFEETKEGDEAR